MKRFERLSFVCCVIVISSCVRSVYGVENVATTANSEDIEQETESPAVDVRNEDLKVEQRSIASHSGMGVDLAQLSEDRQAAFRKRAKPLKNIFMGIYKNYKSTYLGNKTITEYKRTLRTQNQQEGEESEVEDQDTTADAKLPNQNSADLQLDEEADLPSQAEETKTKTQIPKRKKKKQRARKRNRRHKKHTQTAIQLKQQDHINAKIAEPNPSPTHQYDFGPGVNMSLDMNNEIVNLRLDGDNLKDLMQGRWLKGKNEGRGKKYEMITRVLPLFILPFLIQSAVVPFLVTKLKLLLMKSILVGKIAIFLLVVSAIRNSSKMMQTYEVAPSYWAGEPPSRRSELAAAASAAAYNGYRVEGKPTAWIN